MLNFHLMASPPIRVFFRAHCINQLVLSHIPPIYIYMRCILRMLGECSSVILAVLLLAVIKLDVVVDPIYRREALSPCTRIAHHSFVSIISAWQSTMLCCVYYDYMHSCSCRGADWLYVFVWWCAIFSVANTNDGERRWWCRTRKAI